MSPTHTIDRQDQPPPGWLIRRLRGARSVAGLTLAAWFCVCGCTAPHRAPAPVTPAIARVWPPPPDPPRIAFVQSVHRPTDLGIRQSRSRRFLNWVTGSDRGNEPLIRPVGVAVDEQDNLCITDTGSRTVACIDRKEKICRRYRRAGATPFVAPVGVARRHGTIFVADSALGAVLAIREEGGQALAITNRLVRPTGVAVSGGELFVTDAKQDAVFVFASDDGRYLRSFGSRGSDMGQFNIPTHIAADSRGRLYVTDSMNARIQIFRPDGQFVARIGTHGDAPGYFSRPKGVATDSDGHIYVADANFDNIQVFDEQGRILLAVGSAGAGTGEFWLPGGLAISSKDEVFIADTYNRRVVMLKYLKVP